MPKYGVSGVGRETGGGSGGSIYLYKTSGSIIIRSGSGSQGSSYSGGWRGGSVEWWETRTRNSCWN